MKIALKGNIGSGKTTVSEYLCNNYGYYHFNCDKEVANLYLNNKEVIKRVNKEILNCEKDIVDKIELKKVVFSDLTKLKELEEIVYPYLEKLIKSIENNKIVFDCQQIEKIKVDINKRIYIDINKDIEIERVIIRDKREIKEVNKIIDMQSEEEKAYDYIINNNHDLKNLYTQIDEILKDLDD